MKLNEDTLCAMVLNNTALFKKDDILKCTEIGDGNINYVYRIENQAQQSVILKCSADHIRSSGNPLAVDRCRIEIRALLKENELADNSTPQVYYYNLADHYFIMEDLKEYHNLRYELMQEKTFEHLKSDLVSFLTATLLLTTDLVLNPLEKKKLAKEFTNPTLCEISEKLVFTEPYNKAQNRNVISQENKAYFEKELYEDQALKDKVMRIKDKFKNKAQSLLHGDLHSGSIFVNKDKIKILDPEFAFYGPAGYDIGNVLANLIFPLIRAKNTSNNRDFQSYLQETIVYLFDNFKTAGLKLLKERKSEVLGSESYLKQYLAEIMEDAVEMCGTELIRRIVGDAKVPDITTIGDNDARVLAERECVKIGKYLIMQAHKIKCGQDLIDVIAKFDEHRRADDGMGFLIKFENVAWYENGMVKILDRRIFPVEIKYVNCTSYQEVAQAITAMVTQSTGPYTAAAMGMALAAHEARELSKEECLAFLSKAAYTLAHARPTTAFRMQQITGKSLAIAENYLKNNPNDQGLVRELQQYAFDRVNNNYKRYENTACYLADLIPEGGTILTQCFGETIIGTLLKELRKRKNPVKIVCAETRPYFQGARLTASLANEMGFDVTVVCDNMIASLMENRRIDLFTSGADVIAMDGSITNKVGTLQIALLCRHFAIPYYVTGEPNEDVLTDKDVVIEQKDPKLATSSMGVSLVEKGVKGYYPAFDITPKELVKAVVTDRGIFKPDELSKYFEQRAL